MTAELAIQTFALDCLVALPSDNVSIADPDGLCSVDSLRSYTIASDMKHPRSQAFPTKWQ